MKLYSRFLLATLILLVACTSHHKKILIYANSKIEVDETQKNITVQDGTTQVEKELDFSSSGPVVLNITSPGGKYSLEASEDGYWLANIGTDTVVGSLQHTGSTKQTRITQDQLKLQLDSLNKLVKNENVSSAAENYFISPGKIGKISTVTNVKIFGPFTPIPSAFDASTVSEVYKFYDISEVHTIINKLTEMSKYKYQKGDEKTDESKDDDDSVYTIHPTKK
jgi:hypothetical protein